MKKLKRITAKKAAEMILAGKAEIFKESREFYFCYDTEWLKIGYALYRKLLAPMEEAKAIAAGEARKEYERVESIREALHKLPGYAEHVRSLNL